MAAQVEPEKMAGGDGLPAVLPALGIVGGRVLVVAVGGVDVEIVEFPEARERIIAPPPHHGQEQGVERGDVGKAARAFESFEEMSGVDVGLTLVGVMLEEFLTGLGVADAAEDAKFREVQIADRSAVVSTHGGRINLD